MFETLNDCLIECVKAAGGSKAVGNRIWPEKTMEAAQRHLLNCLNEGKAERMTPDQVLLLAKLAREKGCHAYAHFVAHTLSYAEPTPIEPRDEADELRRQFIEGTRALVAMAQRIESLEQRPSLRAA
ncbi:hypothetical protein J7U46_09685 [Pelomonas sp. V22]|uniref:hypothetical protein n=1 Tax=Pelomonas sp. V22 TaxID=2822139 RepID=UPI0024A87DED|nr:hypothetical protein [Pelomonas sp. V22]MDI4633317.1 hypothetical protein [Pelomonas sp. V22]